MADRADFQAAIRDKIRASDAEVERFLLRLTRFLRSEMGEFVEKLSIKKVSAIEAANLLGGLLTRLDEAGLSSVIEEVSGAYAIELRDLRRIFAEAAGGANVITDADFALAEKLIKFDVSIYSEEVKQYAARVRSEIMSGVLLGKTPSVSDLEGILEDRLVAHLNTEIRTQTLAFNRSVTLQKSEDLGLELFLYVGPEDDITRPFCRERVGQIFTRDEIDGWDNGQGLPANVYLGGYNCRHHLRPITSELAKRLGYDDG